MRSAMNRMKLLSGGIATSLMVLAATAVAQTPGEWTMTGRTADLQRYSPLTAINRANVKGLKAAWTFSTGVLNGHEGNPLVFGNVMYVHSAFPNIVYALDLTKPGAPMIWKHVPNQPPEAKPIACCDLVNRGLAYHPSGKLFIELLAGDLLALDAKTGKQLWRVPNADYKTGSTMTNAPIVIKDVVVAGISGGEFGVRGRVTAYDVNSGKELWRGYSTGPDAEVKIVGDANPNYASHRGKDLGVSTWQGDEWQHGGGTTWGWYSYDPQLNLLYYSPDPGRVTRALLGLGESQARAGDVLGARGTFVRAAELARNAGSAQSLAIAALGVGGRFAWGRQYDQELVPLLEEALAAIGNDELELRARLLARLAGALRSQPTREPRASISAEAVETARMLGEPAVLSYALESRWSAIWWVENAPERLKIGDELVSLASGSRDRERVFEAHGLRGSALHELGRLREA